MAHQVEIIEYRKLSDSEYAVLLRCCEPCEKCKVKPEIDYQCTDCHLHWHTMHSSVINSGMEVSIQKAKDIAAENHEATLQAEAKFKVKNGDR